MRPAHPRSIRLTTAEVARRLDVTPRAVRWLVETEQLPCEQSASGELQFHPAIVRRLVDARAEARGRSREARLQAVRLRMLKASGEPRQLSLFGHGLRLVRSGPGKSERVLPPRAVKAAESFANWNGSENVRYVNRKAGGRG